MWMAERALTSLAWLLAPSALAHSPEMKAAVRNIEAYDAWRTRESTRVLDALDRHRIAIADRTILDFGCNDGAMSHVYLGCGAARVIGVDIDAAAIARAQRRSADPRLTFLKSDVGSIPLPDGAVDLAVSYDVFEHVADPPAILRELGRVLRPGGHVLIGTWGWYHPFAPHLWSVMPVPWAHVLVSERTLLRASRHVYHAPWHQPTMHDLDADGQRLPERYAGDRISTDYLNKFLIRDFERAFADAGFAVTTDLMPFGSAPWTRVLLRLPWIREFLTGYAWFFLTKPRSSAPAA